MIAPTPRNCVCGDPSCAEPTDDYRATLEQVRAMRKYEDPGVDMIQKAGDTIAVDLMRDGLKEEELPAACRTLLSVVVAVQDLIGPEDMDTAKVHNVLVALSFAAERLAVHARYDGSPL